MSGKWNSKKHGSLKRDLLRDYCLASVRLQEQFARFDSSGTLSFAIISEIIGTHYNKGLLWRVKDTARHLLRSRQSPSPAGGLLDWTIGFLFHECFQLMESAYQLQYYAPKLNDARGPSLPPLAEKFASGLHALSQESLKGLEHHIDRSRQLMNAASGLFCVYLAEETENRQLARFIYDREELIRQVFGDVFTELVNSVYENEPEKISIEAALSLAETGQTEKAMLAAKKALEQNPNSAAAAKLLISLVPNQASAI